MGGHYYFYFIGRKAEAKKNKQIFHGVIAYKRQNFVNFEAHVLFLNSNSVPFRGKEGKD